MTRPAAVAQKQPPRIPRQTQPRRGRHSECPNSGSPEGRVLVCQPGDSTHADLNSLSLPSVLTKPLPLPVGLDKSLALASPVPTDLKALFGRPCVCGALGPTNANLLRRYSKGLMASRRAKQLTNIKLWFSVTCVCIFREHNV